MTVPLSAWARRRERGSVLLLRFMVWLCLRVSTFLGRVLLWPIALWFTLTAPAAYLQLSGAYDDEGQYAVRQGWPVVRLPLHHLAMLTHAEAVAGAIHGLAERLPHA